MHLETLLAVFIFFMIVFVIGQILNDNSIVDIAWGLGFVVAGIYSFVRGETGMPRATILTLLIALWGLRLTYHIARRNIGKPEDYRYVAMRKKWGHKHIRLKAFLMVYVLQFAVNALVSMPLIYVNCNPNQDIWPMA